MSVQLFVFIRGSQANLSDMIQNRVTITPAELHQALMTVFPMLLSVFLMIKVLQTTPDAGISQENNFLCARL